MLDEFVKQAKRLFSSKSNGGKQVPQLIDQLHTLKQVLLAVALVLMVGYSQFRDHFKCQAVQSLKEDVVTNMCLINGTTTVKQRDTAASSNDQAVSHVGHGFVVDNEDSKVVSHSYTRDLWLILILLVACSFAARDFWARLFQNEVLQALLQLAGSDTNRLAMAAETASPYKMLASGRLEQALDRVQSGQEPASERVTKAIELVDKEVNMYDHKLDYYPNQLIYMLLTRSAASYKMSNLNLSRRLFINSLMSSLLTAGQFLVPLLFIGPEYWSYGWLWLKAAFVYVSALFHWRQPDDGNWSANSFAYELSSSIFPVSVQCEIQIYGNDGAVEAQTTFCTAGINEICAKVFPFVWWFVVLNMLVELYTLMFHSIALLGAGAAESILGRSCWPAARKEANLIATFRHRRAELMARQEQLRRQRNRSNGQMALGGITLDMNNNNDKLKRGASEKEKEADLEANLEVNRGKRRRSSKWHISLLQLVARGWFSPGLNKHTEWRRRRLAREAKRDANIYHLLYLLHLRLGKSKSRSEEVIKMTAGALAVYLKELEESSSKGASENEEASFSESDYKSDSGENEALDV